MLRLVALRGGVVSALAFLPFGLLAGVVDAPFLDTALLCAVVAAPAGAASAVEARAVWREAPALRAGLTAWAAAAAAIVVAGVQAAYTSGAVQGGSIGAGLANVQGLANAVARERVGVLSIGVAAAVLTLPFAAVAVARTRGEGAAGSAWFAAVGALGGVLVLGASAGEFPFGWGLLFAVLPALALNAAYGLADRLDVAWQARAAGARELARLPLEVLWLRASAGDDEARRALGARAPAPVPALEPWVRRLWRGGPAGVSSAALALARLACDALAPVAREEALAAVSEVDVAAAAAGSPAEVATVAQRIAELPLPPLAASSLALAVESRDCWPSERRAYARTLAPLAEEAAASRGEAAVRAALEGALLRRRERPS